MCFISISVHISGIKYYILGIWRLYGEVTGAVAAAIVTGAASAATASAAAATTTEQQQHPVEQVVIDISGDSEVKVIHKNATYGTQSCNQQQQNITNHDSEKKKQSIDQLIQSYRPSGQQQQNQQQHEQNQQNQQQLQQGQKEQSDRQQQLQQQHQLYLQYQQYLQIMQQQAQQQIKDYQQQQMMQKQMQHQQMQQHAQQQEQQNQQNQHNIYQQELWEQWRSKTNQQSQAFNKRQQQKNEEQLQSWQQQIRLQNLHGNNIPMHNNAINNLQRVTNGNHGGASEANVSTNDIFLRLRPNVEMDKIRDYLKSNGVNIINMEKVSNNHARFTSFKIRVHDNDYVKIVNDPFWSLCGAKCRPWNNNGNNNWKNNYNNHMSSVNGPNCGSYDRWDAISLNRNSFNFGR